ncbi:MAG TPA: 3-octaprenyl-4-hydroxybenzoate carboxy-lyase [Verrucomicrobia subdivision 6 bacterium]|jgi:flavin prenyltransferase|uniref:Flavin prenyltransferase UbiX n=1 Tax=Verrucomicrobia subdivision 6 bacterium BACL9 MAG-120924-bin69 TaxID=1655635 RepID=A0A0R2XDN9_9BACT|nr:MAG: 3-octaprenyl-4-hydroxybenzoate carboxy-lyase [Verrucomicrobia subdivision 6 bacterium BACL9 MAG-120924-bin69]HBZ85146.1 3-octaprenyl-4-hydroxybenzoate carboxy-lyase [Verrucomicrobia subdivision 6 bacterium]
MKLVVAVTGASGSIYAQRLLNEIAKSRQVKECHVVLSEHAAEVAATELGAKGLQIPKGMKVHGDKTMQVPFASGSARFEAMAIIPCSMGTLGRIAHGYSNGTIARTADVFLKEKRKLILVPRETPWNLLQARNVVSLMEAGAVMLPAIPSFYGRPQTVQEVADTVVARVLDHLGLPNDLVKRWKSGASEKE